MASALQEHSLEDRVPNDPIEERLREIIMGEIEPEKVVVADYDPAWPARFRQEEAEIRGALGGSVLSVEHIGSTSVAGLAAKPIVAIRLVGYTPRRIYASSSRTPATRRPTCLPSRAPGTSYACASRTPAGIACSGPPRRTFTCTSTRRAPRRSGATLCCASGCARTERTGSSTPGSSGSWPRGIGLAWTTTPGRRPGSSRASSPGPPKCLREEARARRDRPAHRAC